MKPYWRGTLAVKNGVVHVVLRNRGIRVRFHCEPDKWQNIWSILHGEFHHPTCVGCVMSQHAWRHLKSTQEWMAERAEAERRLA
jgi:hypothetical protein